MLRSLIAFLIFSISFGVLALPPESRLSFKQGTFSYYVSHDLKKTDPKVKRAIISIHGSERNAHTYYGSIEAMAKKNAAADETIILSPHFKIASDPLLPNELVWSWEGWLSGDEALNNHVVTAFDLMDHIVSLLADKKKFPNIKEIVLTGHSAGGQLVQRYAGGTSIDTKYTSLGFRFVVANPGSYMYLSANRPFKPSLVCNFNDYKFGLDRRNEYMNRVTKAKLISQYMARNVTYFIGELDNIAEGIDQSCPAQYQGRHRLERGKSFKVQLDREFPANKHTFLSVPGVGHTQYGMYTSELGQKILFQKL